MRCYVGSIHKGKSNASVWCPSVRLSVCPVDRMMKNPHAWENWRVSSTGTAHTAAGKIRRGCARGQHTFRPFLFSFVELSGASRRPPGDRPTSSRVRQHGVICDEMDARPIRSAVDNDYSSWRVFIRRNIRELLNFTHYSMLI